MVHLLGLVFASFLIFTSNNLPNMTAKFVLRMLRTSHLVEEHWNSAVQLSLYFGKWQIYLQDLQHVQKVLWSQSVACGGSGDAYDRSAPPPSEGLSKQSPQPWYIYMSLHLWLCL